MAKVGKLTIDVSAGTAAFIVDMERANQKLNEFGQSTRNLSAAQHGAVSDMQATSAALRGLEGSMNIRAAERFLTTIKGIGPVLQAAFPIFGAVAIGGVLVELGQKANKAIEFLTNLAKVPRQIAEEFSKLDQPLRVANDDLRVTNDKLEISIAKLQGRPANGLKLSLDEARRSADQLAESLGRSLEELSKLTLKKDVGTWDKLIGGQQGTGDVVENVSAFQAKINQITASGSDRLAAVQPGPNSEKQSNDIRKQIRDQLSAAYADEDKWLADQIQKAKERQRQYDVYQEALKTGNKDFLQAYNQLGYNFTPTQTERLSILGGVRRDARDQNSSVSLRFANEGLSSTEAGLQATAGNAKLGRPYDDAITQLQARIQAAQTNASASTSNDDFLKAMAKGAAEADQAIARLTDRLKEMHSALSPNQKSDLTLLEQVAATTQAVTESTNKLQETLKRGEEETDRSTAKQVQEHQNRMAEINDEITAATRLAAAEMQGADAARRAQIDLSVSKIADPDEQAGRRRLAEVQYQAEIDKTVASLDKETASIHRMTAVLDSNLAAKRAAELVNIWNDGKPIEERVAEYNNAQARFGMQDAQNLTGANSDASAGFHKFFDDLNANTKTAAQNVHDILGSAFNSLNDDLVRMIDGQKVKWSSFFRDIAGQLAHAGLNSLEGNMAKALGFDSNGTGQQGQKSGGIFSGGLGAIFHLFGGKQSSGGTSDLDGIPGLTEQDRANLAGFKNSDLTQLFSGFGGTGSPNGSQMSPFYVISADAASGGGAGGLLNSLFAGGDNSGDDGSSGSGGGFGGFLGTLFGGFRASGGGVEPGKGYIVGENGPEPFFPGMSGTILPNRALAGAGSGSGTVNNYFDNRGTNAADTEMRINRALSRVYPDAMRSAAAGIRERDFRRPKGVRW